MAEERRLSSCSSSSTLKLVWWIVPLILVSGIWVLLCPNTTNWVLAATDYPGVRSSVLLLLPPPPPPPPAVFVDPSGKIGSVSSEEESGAHLDLQPRLVGTTGSSINLIDGAHEYSVSVRNRSASPPLAVEASGNQPPVGKITEEVRFNNSATMSGPPFVTSMNESHNLPMRQTLNRKPSNLKKLEAGLVQARAAIRDARNNGNQTQDNDYVPGGPMYWNANAFRRSYLEMEKQFRVFVYEEGEHPIFHNGPCKSIYAMEGNFIYRMEVSPFRTRDPNKAHVFFLPFSVTSLVRFVYERESHNWAPMKETINDYVNLIARKYNYWNRSLGADHFMLACHDWGPELSASVPNLYNNSIRALCNANTSEGFNPAKDVSFPEILLRDGTTNRLLGGPSPSRRPILVFFAGGVHGPIRPILLKHWENRDEDVQVHKYLPKAVSYDGMLRKSRFCICASGYEVASPRMVEALYMGCVPVLIKDHYVAPFSDVLNWKAFSVQIAVRDIPNLKTILTGISQRQYIRLQRRGLQVRRHFEVNLPPKRFDVFHMILHSIWLRRLNVLVREEES